VPAPLLDRKFSGKYLERLSIAVSLVLLREVVDGR
jgi:hypothetical protein